MKKLYKSTNDKFVAGVLGGIGEYYNMDSTLIRLAFLVLCIITAFVPAVIGYIIAAIIVPQKPHSASN